MKGFERLIERLTHRLRVDPELRMDVANELRSHLEDSAAEYRQAGYIETDAAAAAVKALGDPTELAQALWLANRKRIRVRRVIKWVGRLTLVPAAILVTLLVAYHGMSRPALMSMTDQNTRAAYLRSMAVTPEQRFILAGAPKARTYVERQKSIADRWPGNRVYFANYACAYLQGNHEAIFEKEDSRSMDEATRLMDRGRRLEPGNAFYDVCKAAILLNAAGKVEESPKYGYILTDRDGKPRTKPCWTLRVTRRDALAAGLAAMAEGAGKPFFSTHVFDMMQLRNAIVPLPGNLTDYLNRTAFMVGQGTTSLGEPRTAVRVTCAYALDLARQGNKDEAIRLLRWARMIGPKIATGSRTAIELLVAQAIYEADLGHAINAYRALGLTEPTRQAVEELRDQNEFARSLWTPDADVRIDASLHAGLLDTVLVPALPGYRGDFGPMRKTEYALYERITLALFLFGFDALAILLAVATGVSLWLRRKEDDGPKLLFVGWPAMGKIIAGAIVIPLGAFCLYSYILPLGVREYGLSVAIHRALLEIMVAGDIMFLLFLRLSYSSVCKRVRAAGMTVPPPTQSRWREGFVIAGLFLALGALLYEVLWYVNAGRGNISFLQAKTFPWLLTGLLKVAVVAWLVYEVVHLYRMPAVFSHFRRTLVRSLIPIVGLTVIVVGAIFGTLVVHAEAKAIRQVPYFIDHEVEQSNCRLMKARLAGLHDKLLGSGTNVRH